MQVEMQVEMGEERPLVATTKRQLGKEREGGEGGREGGRGRERDTHTHTLPNTLPNTRTHTHTNTLSGAART